MTAADAFTRTFGAHRRQPVPGLLSAAERLRAGVADEALLAVFSAGAGDVRVAPLLTGLGELGRDRFAALGERMDENLLALGLARRDQHGKAITVAPSWALRDARQLSVRVVTAAARRPQPPPVPVVLNDWEQELTELVCVRAGGLLRGAGALHLRDGLGVRRWQNLRRDVADARRMNSRKQQVTQLVMDALPGPAMRPVLDGSDAAAFCSALAEQASRTRRG